MIPQIWKYILQTTNIYKDFSWTFIACTDTCKTARYSTKWRSIVATDHKFDCRRILPSDNSHCVVRGFFSFMMPAGKYYYSNT